MSDIDVQIGRRLSAARVRVGMTQRDVERCTGISRTRINRIETGEWNASILELSALSEACGMLISELDDDGSGADVTGADRMVDPELTALSDYLIYAFGVSGRLDELGVPGTVRQSGMSPDIC